MFFLSKIFIKWQVSRVHSVQAFFLFCEKSTLQSCITSSPLRYGQIQYSPFQNVLNIQSTLESIHLFGTRRTASYCPNSPHSYYRSHSCWFLFMILQRCCHASLSQTLLLMRWLSRPWHIHFAVKIDALWKTDIFWWTHGDCKYVCILSCF